MVTRNPLTKVPAPKAAPAGRLVASWQHDLDAIAMSVRTSCAGLEAVARRKTALIEEALGEWRTVARAMAEIGPRHGLRHLDKLAVASFELALADMRELTALATRSQREALDIVRQRTNENFNNLQRLLRA